MAEVALDVTGRPQVQTHTVFRHTNIGGFLRLPLESGKCDTSRFQITKASPATNGKR